MMMSTNNNSKNLRIMRDPYTKKDIKQQQQQQQQEILLLSPPLTPTEFTFHHDKSEWQQQSNNNKRKSFIKSYLKMVPQLQKNYNNNQGVFALNVYRDLQQQQQQQQVNRVTPILALENSSNKKRDLVTGEQPQKKRKVCNILPSGKEAAMAFDAINIDLSDNEFYPVGWVPNINALDHIPVKVIWKGAPMTIQDQEYHGRLHRAEANMASILRLSPVQYLKCKRTLILAARTLKLQEIPFTKSVAQKLCRVDVNKTSALWTVFGQLGWFNESH